MTRFAKLQDYIESLWHCSKRAFATSLLEVLGVAWCIVEPTAYFFPGFGMWVRPYWVAILLIGAALSLHRARQRRRISERVQGTDAFIELRVVDMFDVSAGFVIACNTTFDTNIEDGTISPNSTQGQFTKRFFDSREEIDKQIRTSLNNTAATKLSKGEKPYGKQTIYPIGTVTAVSGGSQKAYLVAITTLNEHKVASATIEDVLDALPATWEYIRTRGELGALCCPILGAGYSRVDATREDLIREIIKSFVSASREGFFCDKLTIAIAPGDFRSGSIDLERLQRFLEHECFYPRPRSSGTSNAPKGHPA